MKIKLIHFLVTTTLVFSLGAGAVVPVPPADDNGDVSFVRQIVPKLLGRKPRGTREVNLLADIAALHGREALVRLLMQQPEFSTHWVAILSDQLKLQRDGGRAQAAACFDAPSPGDGGLNTELGVPVNPAALAAFVRDNGIGAVYAKSFNMYDLTASAIALDNLFPLYRAYLFSLGSRPPGSGMRNETERRAEVGIAFDDIYLNRNMECMSCHRGSYSTTGIGIRTHPLYETLDLAMFDHTGLGEVTVIDNADYPQCAVCHGADAQGGIGPGILGWSAGALKTVLQNPPQGMVGDWSALSSDDDRLQALAEALNGPFGQAEIEKTAAMHYAVFRTDLFEGESEQDPPSLNPWGISSECASIHGTARQGPIPAFFAGVADDYASVLAVEQDFTSGYGGLKAALPSMPSWDQTGTIPGDTGFAYMVAAKVTDNVWEALMGERLTIVNQFARNNLQRDLHRHLLEDVFIAHDWSLKELIVAVLKTRFFNRRAPAASQQASPYLLPAVFDPFVVADQTCLSGSGSDGGGLLASDTLTRGDSSSGLTRADDFSSGEDCAYNGQGELVHRYAPRVLLNSVSAALDWPKPRIFPTAAFPDMEFTKSVGQYVSDQDQGEREVSFQSLLNWDGQYGICQNPAQASGGDWIDRLVLAVDEFNSAHPAAPLNLGEVVLSVKDWLLQEPVFGGYQRPADPLEPVSPFFTATAVGDWAPEPTEAELVEALFGLPLASAVSSASFGDGAKLRELCGVYLKSPQFMLAGVVRGERFQAPRLSVCNREPCGYQPLCSSYAPVLNQLGYATVCQPGGVSKPLPLGFGSREDEGGSGLDGLSTRESGLKILQIGGSRFTLR